MALFKVFNYDVNGALLVSFIYSVFSLILFIIVCVFGWNKVRENERKQEEAKKEADEAYEIKKKGGCKLILSWMKLVWKMKSIYLSALVHIYDIATDVGIIVDWGTQMQRENDNPILSKHNVRGLDMRGLFAGSLLAFFLYRFISAGFVYQFTGKFGRACIQWLDLEIYRAIYITHKLERDEAGNLQRWLQKFEAIFESAPQSLLQLVYIVKTGDYNQLIVSSIILSFFSVAARFTSDDKIFFNADAEGLGLKWKKRSKNKVTNEPEPEVLSQKSMTPSSNDEHIDHAVTVDVLDDDEEINTKLTKNHANIEDEEVAAPDAQWPKWKVWNHIGFNRAYLFRYSFRMCDVFSRLMIMALLWCTLNGITVSCILLFEVFTFVIYAVRIGKYNFFQFLVATYFSEIDREQTVSYCFIRRMESLIYLIVVSIVILFGDKYNNDSIIQCHLEYCNEDNWLQYKSTPFPGSCLNTTSRNLCELATNYDRNVCDCNFEEEVLATKVLLLAAWAFANLSGSVFFGAFHNMRKKFGTNERNIVNVMQKRDWEAFGEMLEFGYRMDRFDKKTNRSALSTFLDRVPSDKFEVKDVNLMIKLGANINDRSVNPQNEKDEPEPDKIGDNVLIRYIKVTPCDVIDREFKDVVEKWTKEGIDQKGTRITVDINASNDLGYTPFKVYWEKMQYERRLRLTKRRDIIYKKKCHRIEHEYTEDNAPRLEHLERQERKNEEWFLIFYEYILKWKHLGADMSTVSEDRISPLLAYIQDTPIRAHAKKDDDDNTRYIDMDIVRELCPMHAQDTNQGDEEEQKYQNHDENPKKENSNINTNYMTNLTLQIKRKAFAIWIKKYDEKKVMFSVRDIAIWHDLGCTGNIRHMNLLSVYLMRCEPSIQNVNDIDTLIECGCDAENEKMKQYVCYRPLPMTDVIDHARGFYDKSKMELFDDALAQWHARHDLKYYDKNGDSPLFKYIKEHRSCESIKAAISYAGKVYTKREDLPNYWSYADELDKYVGYTKARAVVSKCWDERPRGVQIATPINLKIWKHLQGKFGLKPERTDFEAYDMDQYSTRLQQIIQTHSILSVDDVKKLINGGYLLVHKGANVKTLLTDAAMNTDLHFDVFEYLIDEVIARIDQEEEKEAIFNQWIKQNKHITFEAIESLIDKYGFSPYLSESGVDCAVHYIWQNAHVPLDVCHRVWIKWGIPKFGKFDGLYQSFLFEVIEHRNVTAMEEIEQLEAMFKDEIRAADKKTGNNIIHYYCKNEHVDMQILRHLCAKYESLLDQRNKQDLHALHLLCQNRSLKIEFLKYFVVELGVPMNTQTDAGWQFQALHHLVDNESVTWNKEEVQIMIDDLKIDFMTQRAGQFILFRLSRQCNFTTQALIYLYGHYRDIVDLNSLKSRKTMYSNSTSRGGKTILANLVSRKLDITPKQIKTLVEVIGLDIAAKDRDNKTVLHFASNKHLTPSKLQVIGTLLQDKLKDQFVVDLSDRKGTTPFQKWLNAVGKEVAKHMDVVKVWESLGSDITQLDNRTSFNMLHYYLDNNTWDIQLAYIRKMCFDHENPWKSHEKHAERKERKVGKYQIPMHVRPIPDNKTLSLLYAQSAEASDEQVNIEVFKYFKKQEVRFDRDAPKNVLWHYVATTDVNVETLRFLIDDMGFSTQPQPQDNAALQYMTYQSTRDKINWDVLDYFHNDLKVDFKHKQKDYVTILHLYAQKATPFDCGDFRKLIKRYHLSDILKTGSTDPTAAGVFYQDRRSSIRPDIIECFTSLGYDIHETVKNMTPIHYYCQLTSDHYIVPSVVESFIKHGADIHGKFVNKQYNSVCQIVANSIPDKSHRYTHIKALQMMMDQFDVQLQVPNKRKQGLWYTFIAYYEACSDWDVLFEQFVSLIRIHIEANAEPKTLLHDDEIDANKKIKYKLYSIDDVETKEVLNSIENRKVVAEARKYVGRIVFVTDDRDSVFRSCMTIDPHSSSDCAVKIPQIWLIPIKWKDFATQIKDISTSDRNFKKSLALAKSNVFIDMDLVKQIVSLHSSPEMINHILLPKMKENILLKYLRCNHESQIFAEDINQFAELSIDFKFGYKDCNHALLNYCKYSDGEINDSIVNALKNGGCPINWDVEENEDEKGQGKGVVVKTKFTPLQSYAKLTDSNLTSFQKLMECGADVSIESRENFTAVYYLLKYSENATPAFIEYLSNNCKYNFSQPLVAAEDEERNLLVSMGFPESDDADTLLFNVYLRFNKNITKETITALVNSAHCDPNSRDGVNDTNSIKSYIKNANIDKFSMDIIRILVQLGADINEADDEGVYPIQHLLLMVYTPLSQLMDHVQIMIELGAKFEHILCDDDAAIQDHKLYILQNMKDGYEHHNDRWGTVKTYAWTERKSHSQMQYETINVQLAVAFDELHSNETLFINIRRSNLIDISKKQLFEKYPQLKTVNQEEDTLGEEDEDDDCKVEQD